MPHLSLFAWLVRHLEYDELVRIMVALNSVIALLMVVALARRMTDDWMLQLAIVCTFGSAYAVESPVLLGQNALINLLFTAGFVLFYLEGRRVLPVGCFLLASITKPWGFLFILLPLLKRDYRMVSVLLLSLVAVFGAQYLWEPELVKGYVEQTHRHGVVSILGHNNVSLAAALHRLSLVADGGGWQSWEKWVHAGQAPVAITVIRYGLTLSVILIGWIARSDVLKAHSMLLALFLLANVYWNFYALMLVPLVLSTLLTLKSTTETSTTWRYAFGGAYILAVIIGSSYRPGLGPWSQFPGLAPWSQLEPYVIGISAADALKSLGFFMLAVLVLMTAFRKHRLGASLLTLGLILAYNLPMLFLFQIIEYFMINRIPHWSINTLAALVTFVPSALFLACFALQCWRETALGADWRRRLFSFRPSNS